jgi:uncharacterized protein (DUF697 family)
MDQFLILTHAVLAGLTPLIPIPFLDDLVKAYFLRNLVSSLAKTYQVELSPAEATALADDRGGGCVNGCLTWLILYPVKRLIGKIVFVLEWQRAIDIVTHTYYFGYLLNYVFKQGIYRPGDIAQATRLRVAIEQARQGANTGFVRRIVQANFNQSRQLIVDAVGQLSASLLGLTISFRRASTWARRRLMLTLNRRGSRLAKWMSTRVRLKEKDSAQVSRTESELAQRLDKETNILSSALDGLVHQLQTRLTDLPPQHFEELEARLMSGLKNKK